jgi:hypothetical protein
MSSWAGLVSVRWRKVPAGPVKVPTAMRSSSRRRFGQVASQQAQRARRGRSRAVFPFSRRIARSRHGPSAAAALCRRTGRPGARPPGQQTRRRHRRTAARKAFQVTTATMPPPDVHPPGGTRVAACPLRRRLATRTASSAGKRHHGHQLHHAHLILTEGKSLRLAEATAGKGVTPLT